MCDILPPKMSDRAADLELEASLTSMDWLPKLNVQAIRDAATVEKDKKSRKSNGDSESDGPSKDGKPPYSYANLIQLAINSSENKKMTLSEIYSWICENFPYYQDIGNGWKNSIRHNLSLNKCFTRVARTKNDPGKGSYWTIDTSPQEEPLPFRARKRKSGEISGYEHSPNACYDASGELSSPSFTPGSGQSYSAMTSPEHAGSPPHHSTPLNHFHSPPLPHNDHNNNPSMNLANLPLNDLSASFKSLYRSVIQPTSQVFNRSNASICSTDQQGNRSYNNSSSCSAQSFNNSNSHSMIDHRHHRNHMNHISPLAQSHMTSPQQVHLDSSVESTSGMMHRRHYNTRSQTHLNNSVTLNQVNKSFANASGSGLNFDWSNIESLKNSFMNVNWPDVDFNQFPDLLENMQKADSNDWELDQQTALDLCSSLSRVFQQSGYGYHHPSSSSVSTSSSSVGDGTGQMNRAYMQQHSQQHITSPMIPNHQLSRSIPVSPPHAVAGDMRHVQAQPTLSGSAPQPTTTQHMRQPSVMPPRYAPPQQPHQQSQQEEIIDTFDWDSIC